MNILSLTSAKIQVIVGETEGRELEMEAFVLPNQVQSAPGLSKKGNLENVLQAIDDNTPLESFHVPPDSVERYLLASPSFLRLNPLVFSKILSVYFLSAMKKRKKTRVSSAMHASPNCSITAKLCLPTF